METVNKNSLIEELSSQTGLPNPACRRAVENLLSIMQGHLREGKVIRLVNFGVFKTVESKNVVFTPSKSMLMRSEECVHLPSDV